MWAKEETKNKRAKNLQDDRVIYKRKQFQENCIKTLHTQLNERQQKMNDNIPLHGDDVIELMTTKNNMHR